KPILQSTLLMVEGKLQVEGEVIHVLVKHCHNLSALFRRPDGEEEEAKTVVAEGQQGKLFANARNFR
ncbi:MAG TPA: hypothetical protein VNW04_18340, partial [Puia sp.]|nr:hypothetical protein [Puia sp.]